MLGLGVGRQESGDRRLFYLFSPHPTPHTLSPRKTFSADPNYYPYC
ncbi:MAG: hypothetical protein PX634_02355 [Microcystis sp. M53600_WE12]|nr:hypothetical protein [Microcystis sp. M53600_WE12]